MLLRIADLQACYLSKHENYEKPWIVGEIRNEGLFCSEFFIDRYSCKITYAPDVSFVFQYDSSGT